MSRSNRKTQEIEILQEMPVISTSLQELDIPVPKTVKICWNIGEEKTASPTTSAKDPKPKHKYFSLKLRLTITAFTAFKK